MLHQIDSLGFFDLTVAVWIQRCNQVCLQTLCKNFTSGGIRIEYLCPGVTAVGKSILMYAQKNCALGFVADPDPFFQIGHFFLSNGVAVCVDGYIPGPDHPGLVAQKMEQIPGSESNLQIEGALQLSCAGGGTTIQTAMTRIYDETMGPYWRHILGDHRHRPAPQTGHSQCQQDRGGVDQFQSMFFIQIPHLIVTVCIL